MQNLTPELVQEAQTSTFWLSGFFFLAAPRGMRDLSSLTRHQTCGPCSESVES